MNDYSNLEFRAIPSLHFLFEVNANGTILRNVKSKKRMKIKVEYHHTKTGYCMSMVSIKGKTIRVMIHTVVAECWLGKRPVGMEIDHIDRDSTNNWYWNLRYVSHSEQMKNRVMSQKVLSIAKRNCYEYTMKYVARPVEVERKDGSERMWFPSMIQCSSYLGGVYNVKPESIRAKLKKRRSSIYDYNVKYFLPEMQRLDTAT